MREPRIGIAAMLTISCTRGSKPVVSQSSEITSVACSRNRKRYWILLMTIQSSNRRKARAILGLRSKQAEMIAVADHLAEAFYHPQGVAQQVAVARRELADPHDRLGLVRAGLDRAQLRARAQLHE